MPRPSGGPFFSDSRRAAHDAERLAPSHTVVLELVALPGPPRVRGIASPG